MLLFFRYIPLDRKKDINEYIDPWFTLHKVNILLALVSAIGNNGISIFCIDVHRGGGITVFDTTGERGRGSENDQFSERPL